MFFAGEYQRAAAEPSPGVFIVFEGCLQYVAPINSGPDHVSAQIAQAHVVERRRRKPRLEKIQHAPIASGRKLVRCVGDFKLALNILRIAARRRWQQRLRLTHRCSTGGVVNQKILGI